MKTLIANVLTELRQEESTLEERLRLVRDGICAMERLSEVYNAPVTQALSAVAEPSKELVVVAKPRSAAVPAAEAAAYVAEHASVAAAPAAAKDEKSEEPLVAKAAVVAPAAHAKVEQSHEEMVAQLSHDVNNWYPVLKRQKLEDIYLMLLLRKDRFTKDLPPTLDLGNAQVVRTLTNHLRHEAVPGYYQLCARLKQHEHLSYLYRRARDKATGSIMQAYPELFAAAQQTTPAEVQNISPIPSDYKAEELPPSGAHHFAALQGLGRTTSAAAA
jgi:hypothetical protein